MQNCPRCSFKKWLKTSKCNEDGIRFWKCGRCGNEQLGDYPFIRQQPKILYFDIENSLTDLHGNFGLTVKGERLNPVMVKTPYFIICWSAQWVGKKKIYSGCVTQEEALQRNDKNILAPLWDLMDEADVLAGHNVKYDIKSANTRFLINGFQKPEFHNKIYDTLKVARKELRPESKSLDYLLRILGINGKDHMTIQDWIDIQEKGDPKALRKMLRYNKHDVQYGVQALSILKGWSPEKADFGMITFAKEPLDKRKEAPSPLREIQDSLELSERLNQ